MASVKINSPNRSCGFDRGEIQASALSARQLIREERKVGPYVWVFRWREQMPEGRVRRKVVVGTVDQYRSKSAAQKVADAFRANINKQTWMPLTVEQLVGHYTEKELPNLLARRRTAKGCSACRCARGYRQTHRLAYVPSFVCDIIESEWRRRKGCAGELASREQQNCAGCVHARFNADQVPGTGPGGKILIEPNGSTPARSVAASA